MEIWRDIKGFEGFYQVSNTGRVKSLERTCLIKNIFPYTKKERILKPYLTGRGYYSVRFYTYKKTNIQVHQLVAIAFLGHKLNGHELVVNHKDLNKTNNNVLNLEIITNRENCNKIHLNSASKFIGVYKKRNKWYSVISFGYNKKYLGSFNSEQEAKNAYDEAYNLYVLKKYKVEVWFRYVCNNEVEKGFEIHYTYALSQEDAKRKVTIEHYSGHSAIPFKYEVNQIN